MRRMTATVLLALGAAGITGAKCGDDPDESALIGGDVVADTTSYQALDYAVSSDGYNKWLVAEAALDTAGIDASEQIDVSDVDDDDVDRVVRSLDEQPKAKAAIEGAGLSVRDFVLTTIALAQSWDAVNSTGTRVVGLPESNVQLFRLRSASDPVSVRPSTRFIRYHDGHPGRGKAKGKHKDKRGKGNGR